MDDSAVIERWSPQQATRLPFVCMGLLLPLALNPGRRDQSMAFSVSF